MIEHVFSAMCSGISIDAETNAVSLFKVLEQLTVFTESKDPVRIPMRFEIVSLWTRQSPDVPSRGKMRIIFCNPNNQQKQHAELGIDLNKATNHRTRVISEGIELTGPGRYRFIIELQEEDDAAWQKVASLPLQVIYQSSSEKG